MKSDNSFGSLSLALKLTDTEKHLMPNVIDEVAISERVIL